MGLTLFQAQVGMSLTIIISLILSHKISFIYYYDF